MRSKLFIIFVLLLLSISYTNLRSCPWLPAGVSNTPAWSTASNKVNVKIVDGANCNIEFEYCWRINSSGQKEVILGPFKITGSTPWYWFSSCKNEYYRKQELIRDYAINVIVNQRNIFNDPPIDWCPAYNNKTYRVYQSKCETEPFPNWGYGAGTYYVQNCSDDGFCLYEYKYCKVIKANLDVESTYTRTLLQQAGEACGVQYWDSYAQMYRTCYPQDCKPSRFNIFVPDEVDIWSDPDMSDDLYFLTNAY